MRGYSKPKILSINRELAVKVKVKFSPEEAMKAQRGSKAIVLKRSGWSTSRPGRFTPGMKAGTH
jgi:hypothetical protein